MKKSFGAYFVGWLAALGFFNLIVFITPNEIDGVSKFDNLFWVGYIFITLFFVGQLACMYFVFNAGSAQKSFYNFPLIGIGTTSLVVMLIFGTLCMAVIQIPVWLGIIICCGILLFNILAVAKAAVAISAISGIDKEVKTKTMFIKMLSADAQTLTTMANSPEMQKITHTVFEAIRYSDPMSDAALYAVEMNISETFRNFYMAVQANDVVAAQNLSGVLLTQISERNAKCKILK